MSNSVSKWIVDLQKGDGEAARQLWDRYFAKLVTAARKTIGVAPRRTGDEEDVAVSVFESLCRGAAAGRFSELKDRHELWWLLLALTKRKVINQIRRDTSLKRGQNTVQGETEVPNDPATGEKFDLRSILDDVPSPDLLVQMDEEWQRLLNMLRDDTLRRIACWRIEGYPIDEIADKLNVLPRTVSRKLHLIRTRWSEESMP